MHPAGNCPSNLPTIRFLSVPMADTLYQDRVATFNVQNPDMCVALVPNSLTTGAVSFEPDITALQQQLAQADVLELPRLDIIDSTMPLFLDLKPLIDADPAFDIADVYPQALEQMGAANSIMMLPQTLSITTLSYNRTVWQARQLPQPNAHWGWRDILVAAAALTQRGSNPIYGMLDDHALMTTKYMLVEQQVPVEALTAATLDVQQPVFRKVLEQAQRLLNTQVIYSPPPNQPTNADYFAPVLAGRVGIWPGSSLDDPLFDDAFRQKLGWIAYPRYKNSLPAPALINGLVINKSTSQPQLAWRWLRFLSKEMPNTSFWNSEMFPIRRSIYRQAGPWNNYPPAYRAVLEQVAEQPLATDHARLFDNGIYVLDTALAAIAEQRASVPAALATAQTLVDQARAEQHGATPLPALAPVPVAHDAPDVPEGSIAIQFGNHSFDDGVLQQLARRFTREHPEIVVQVQPSLAPDLTSAARQFDCFSWNSPGAAVSPELADLQPFIDADATFMPGNLVPTLLGALRDQGQLRLLPYTLALPSLAYNPAIFDRTNLPYPRDSWTIETLQRSAQQLHHPAQAVPQYGFVAQATSAEQQLFLQEQGAMLTRTTSDGVQPALTDAGVVRAAQRYVDLLRTAGQPRQFVAFTAAFTQTELVNQGQAAMWFDSVDGPIVPPYSVGVALVAPPFGGQPPRLQPANVRVALAISAQSQQQAACWRWIVFVSQQPELFHSGYPAWMSLAETPDFTARTLPGAAEVYHAYVQALQHAHTTSPAPTDELGAFWFHQAIDQALAGTEVTAALAAAQQHALAFQACIAQGSPPDACPSH